MKDSEVEITVRKFRKFFHKDLVFAAQHGFCSGKMFVTLKALAYMIEADVQASERLNKTLTLFGERCPGGSLELCSGRLGLKYFLGLSGYGLVERRRYKDVKDTARLLLEECIAGWPLIHEVEGTEDRFRHVEQRNDIATLNDAKKVGSFLDPVSYPRLGVAKLWAATMNSKFSKFLGEQEQQYPGCDRGLGAISFVNKGRAFRDSKQLFLVCDRVRTALHFLPFRRMNSLDTEDLFCVRSPCAIMKSHTVFERLYENLTAKQTTGQISVVHVRVHTLEETYLI